MHNLRFGYVGTYPPTHCGLATFTVALRKAMVGPEHGNGLVIRLVEAPEPRPSNEVVAQLVQGDKSSLSVAVARLRDCDVAIVQHEYGIYGGVDGDEVLDLLNQLTIPSIVVLHTVLSEPTPHQREVLESVVAKADAVVTMTESARARLVDGYCIDRTKLSIIAHGATEMMISAPSPVFRTGRPLVLSWGLIGPGKGIEWGIEAMALLADLTSAPRYLIAGQTHPKVLLREGETYRNDLEDTVARLGLASSVEFDSRYRDVAALAALVRSADVVLLPYDSTDQVTSGVLIEAIAAGKPVVATAFPHARELLADGAGIVVPHRDPAAIATALRTILTSQAVAQRMAAAASTAAPHLLWPAVAEQYRELASRLLAARLAA